MTRNTLCCPDRSFSELITALGIVFGRYSNDRRQEDSLWTSMTLIQVQGVVETASEVEGCVIRFTERHFHVTTQNTKQQNIILTLFITQRTIMSSRKTSAESLLIHIVIRSQSCEKPLRQGNSTAEGLRGNRSLSPSGEQHYLQVASPCII
jgi:ribulose bisphosphate carboxylase small subunit